MLKGISIPFNVNPAGGAVTIEGPAIINQNIILALRPASSLHPWHQDIAPEETFIFDIRDNQTGGLYTMHVRSFFDQMERAGYARLLPGTKGLSVIQADDNSGDMTVRVNFINLETGRESGFEFPLTRGR